MSSIGQLNEQPLHHSLKAWCARPGARFEVAVDRYVVDVVQDGMLLEIQTGGFAAIKSKLIDLLRAHRVRLIHPIAREKWILKPSGKDGRMTRRKSPKRGRIEGLFWELASFPELIAHPGFSLEVLMTREEEVRKHDPKRGWRRRGWVVEERSLLEVVDRRLFEEPADLRSLLPEGMAASFTANDVAEAAGIGRRLAQKMVYCLRKAGVIQLNGREGRAHRYALAIRRLRRSDGGPRAAGVGQTRKSCSP